MGWVNKMFLSCIESDIRQIITIRADGLSEFLLTDNYRQ
jgi:hypothetical protein